MPRPKILLRTFVSDKGTHLFNQSPRHFSDCGKHYRTRPTAVLKKYIVLLENVAHIFAHSKTIITII